jgi:hypothetical protein
MTRCGLPGILAGHSFFGVDVFKAADRGRLVVVDLLIFCSIPLIPNLDSI